MTYLKTILKNSGFDKTLVCEHCGAQGMIYDDEFLTCNRCSYVRKRLKTVV